MNVCPLCHQCLEEGQSLQLHYFSCPAKTEKKGEIGDQMEKSMVDVRLRWAKVEPCVERIVHLITNLAGSIPLHWSDSEGLYESALAKVPVGTYTCQLAVEGDIIPIDEFDVTERCDTIYIIPTEEEEIPEEIEGGSDDGIIDDDDDPVADLLASASIAGSNDLSKEEFPGTFREQHSGITRDNLSPEDRKIPAKSSVTELSPLYKELLQHQVLHGEPSWVPRGDDQSPTASDHELHELMTRTGTEEGPPPILTSQPANPEERHLKSPVPIRPISNQDERHRDILPGARGEGTEERGPGTEDAKGRGDRYGSKSPSASSSTYSGSNSGHSSARHSPDVLSDGSDDLQEQSLEEAIPRDSPEIRELPQPYDGTFLTSDKTEDVPSRKDSKDKEGTRKSPSGAARDVPPSPLVHSPREKKTSSPLSSGSTTNQSSVRASPHSETRMGSVPGSRGSPTASVHLLDRIPSSSGAQDSIYPSITSLPDPGILQGSLRSMDEEHKSPPSSERDRTPVAFSPAGSTHSSIRKPSAEDIGTPPPSERDRTPVASSPAGSTHSSIRKPSAEDIGTPPPSETGRTPPVSSPLGSAHSSTQSSRGQSPIAPVGSLPGQSTITGITSPTAVSTSSTGSIHSPPASAHSSTRSSRGQSPIVSVGSLPGQDTKHPGITSQTAISTSPAGSIHSSLASVHSRSSRGQSPIASVCFNPGQGTMYPGTTSPAAISSLHSSARSTPRGTSPVRRSSADFPSSVVPKEGEHDILSKYSRGSPTFSHEKRESPRSSVSGTRVDSFLESRDTKPAFSRELLGSLSPRSSGHSRVSPLLSHGSREAFGITSQRSLIDSFDNIRDHRTVFNYGPSGDQRPRSSERPRDDDHRRPEGKEEWMIPGQFIPSSSSAFAPTNRDRAKLDVNHNEEKKAILREQEQFQEKQSRFEAEIRRLREVNEDLKQQLLSVEAAAALSERDNEKSLGLEATVASLKDTVKVKDEEIAQLKKRCEELQKINQEMKDEQESLKTVNKLTYDDFKKENLDLRVKINDMQRTSYGSPMKTYTYADEILNNMLREKVAQLEADKNELKQKYSKIKLELDQTKAEKILSDSRLKRARSETDLGEKFNRYTTYSKPDPGKDIYDQSWAKTSSGLGSSHYSWSDNNFDSAYKVSSGTTRDSGLTNGLTSGLSRDTYSSLRDAHVTEKPLYGTSRRFHSSIDDDIDGISDTVEQDFDYGSAHARDRHRTLSSESSNSSLLEYEYGTNIRVPYQPSGRGRRVRPHSFHADTTVLDSDKQTANGDINHYRSLSHSPSRTKDYGTSSRPSDFGSKYSIREYGSLPGRYKTSSSVTTPYSTTTRYPRTSSSKPFSPASSEEIELGMRVMVTRNSGICGHGIVKYVGMLPGKDGPYIGVELDTGDGRHDGSFQGQRFFKCKPNRGIFVRLSKVLMCYPK